ncbi:MAG TPA: cellulase family glycosylhydrolase [Galbitalea sp.]|jgi:endo-1,4-beta-mannosidase|nr:cellulase family glycosylhydrolase [Galbitalea sp.]
MKRHAVKAGTTADPELWVGVNFWSRSGGPRMWTNYDAEIVREELRVMRDHGMTVTRSFLYWPDAMPTPDAVDESVMANFENFLDLHAELGMTTIPTFIVGHMSGENWDPAWRDGRDIFEDVWFVARQAFYIRSVVERVGQHAAIKAWLLTNEIPIYAHWQTRGVGTSAASVISWAQLLIDAIRAGGSEKPVSIGDGAWGIELSGSDNGFRTRDIAKLVDFLGPHVYRMETDQMRQFLGAAFICELLDFDGRPVVLEEFGLTSDYVSEENAAHYYRQFLHNSLLAGATGWLCWNNTDYDSIQAQAPYVHHPFELHFGITTNDGTPKAQAREMKDFADLLERLDVVHTSRPDAAVAILVSSFLEAQYPFREERDATIVVETTRQAYVASREADLPVVLAREVDGLPEDARVIILPSAKQLLATSWARLRELAEAGAVVYASHYVGEHSNQRGSWWPNVDETFGVQKQSRYGLVEPVVEDVLRARFVAPFGNIAAGETLEFRVGGNENSRSFLPVVATDAEVLAVDERDRPVLLRRRAGKGQLVLSTYPLEYFAAVNREVNPEPTHRIYAALAAEAGVVPDVRVDDPRVLVSELAHDDGTRLIWFVSESNESLTVTPILTSGALYDGEQVASTVTLAPFGVAVRTLRLP